MFKYNTPENNYDIEPTTTLGKNLLKILKDRNMNFYQFGKLMGKHPGYMARIVKGEHQPGTKNLNLIAEKLNVTTDYLLNEHTEEEVPTRKTEPLEIVQEIENRVKELKHIGVQWLGAGRWISVKGRIPAGLPCIKTEEPDMTPVWIAYGDLPPSNSESDLYAVLAEGDSLIGDGINDGDRLIVMPVHEIDQNGKIYYCEVNGKCTAKHVFRNTDGSFRLKASNDHYEDIIPGELSIKGRVIFIQPAGRPA